MFQYGSHGLSILTATDASYREFRFAASSRMEHLVISDHARAKIEERRIADGKKVDGLRR